MRVSKGMAELYRMREEALSKTDQIVKISLRLKRGERLNYIEIRGSIFEIIYCFNEILIEINYLMYGTGVSTRIRNNGTNKYDELREEAIFSKWTSLFNLSNSELRYGYFHFKNTREADFLRNLEKVCEESISKAKNLLNLIKD